MLTTVFGKRGSGKTTMIRKMISVARKPAIVIDVLGNYTPGQDGNPAEWKIARSTTEMLRELRAYSENIEDHIGVLVVQAPNVIEAVDFASSALWTLHGGTLVFDEADFVTLAEAPALDDLVRYGRNRGVDIITGCRRPAELSKNITAGSDRFLCFTTHEPRDIDYFSKLFGKEVAEELPKLKKHHGIYIHYPLECRGTYRTEASGAIKVLSKHALS